MKKSESHVLIKHYFLRGKSIKETEEKLAKHYKEFCNIYFGLGSA